MDRTNLDDSSRYYGLGHNHVLTAHAIDEKRRPAAVQTETGGWVRGVHQDRENEAHFREALESGIFDWLIEHMKRDPDTRDRQPAERERMAYVRYFSIRGGAHDRVRTYIEVHHMDLQVAIMKAESDVTEADELEEVISVVTFERKPKDEYLGDSAENLMAHETSGAGGGSKSKSKKTITKADAPVVENALRKQMAA